MVIFCRVTVSGPLVPPAALSLEDKDKSCPLSPPPLIGCRAVPVGVTDSAEIISAFLNPSHKQVHVLTCLPGEDYPSLIWCQQLRHYHVLGDPLSGGGRCHGKVFHLVHISLSHQLNVVEAIRWDWLDVIESFAVESDILC